MAVFICKTCGAGIPYSDDMSAVTCSACGAENVIAGGEAAAAGRDDAALTRAFAHLNAGEFEQAAKCLEEALTESPEDTRIWWGKLLLSMQAPNNDALLRMGIPVGRRKEYRQAYAFADDVTRRAYELLNDAIVEEAYEKGVEACNKGMFDIAEQWFSHVGSEKLRDPRGYWGMVLALTKNFTVYNIDHVDYYMRALKFAEQTVAEKMAERYSEYLELLRRLMFLSGDKQEIDRIGMFLATVDMSDKGNARRYLDIAQAFTQSFTVAENGHIRYVVLARKHAAEVGEEELEYIDSVYGRYIGRMANEAVKKAREGEDFSAHEKLLTAVVPDDFRIYFAKLIAATKNFTDYENTEHIALAAEAIERAGDNVGLVNAPYQRYLREIEERRSGRKQRSAAAAQSAGAQPERQAAQKTTPTREKPKISPFKSAGFITMAALTLVSLLFLLIPSLFLKVNLNLITVLIAALDVGLGVLMFARSKPKAVRRITLLMIIPALAFFFLGRTSAPKRLGAVEISSVEEMKSVRRFFTGNYVLTADLDFAESGFELKTLKGSFDGNGHTISNCSGFVVKNKGSIKNITFENCTSGSATVCEENYGTVENCVVGASCMSIGGGIAVENYGKITGCLNRGGVSSYKKDAGGIVCRNYGAVELSANYGTVTAAAKGDSGGIAGLCESKKKQAPIVSRCANFGTIISVDSEGNVGGIVGRINGSKKGGVTVENCIHQGSVSVVSANAAGIVGLTDKGQYVAITNCVCMGDVKASSTASYAITAAGEGTAHANCYYLEGSADSYNDYSGILEVSERELVLASVFAGLDFENIWMISKNGPELRQFYVEPEPSDEDDPIPEHIPHPDTQIDDSKLEVKPDEIADVGDVYQVKVELNIRSGPGVEYELLGTMPANEVIAVYATSGTWGLVIYDNMYAWTSLNYLNVMT